MVTQNQIKDYFKEVCGAAKEHSYPFSMNWRVHNETKNEETIQLSSGVNKTGVVEKINTLDAKGWKAEAEKGASLVASFASNGSVAFIIYPYKSERYSRNEDSIILYHNLSPDAVTSKLLKTCISKYLLYIRNSSIYGSYSFSFLDFIRINMMITVDIRNRKNIYRAAYSMLAEWSKIISAGVAGYIVAILIRGS